MSVVAYARLVREELEESLGSVDRSLVSGNLKDFEEYRYVAGKRVGLMQALSIVDDAVRRFDEQD